MSEVTASNFLFPNSSDIPVFAVVGKVNAGKSSVLATFLEVDDNEIIRVSATPGETTRCQVLPLEFNGEEKIRFLDTPGFSRSIEAMREIQAIHGEGTPDIESVRAFLEKYEGTHEFEDECLLLGPLMEGAGLLYVIDASKPLRDEFVAEMEILRWTGRKRMALLNSKGGESTYLQAWKDRLGSYFNLVRTFNAHHARFEERRKLLRSLLEIDESHADIIQSTINSLDDEWKMRRNDSAEVILEVLEKAMLLRESKVLDERDVKLEHRREKIQAEMAATYYKKVTGLLSKGVDKLLKIYRHHLIKVDLDSFGWKELDLEAKETWSKYGLSRSQLVMAGAVTGAAAGAAIDAATVLLSHGAGALLGGLGGGAAAFFKGEKLPDIKVDIRKGVKFQGGEGRKLELGPPKSENFPWVLLDRMLAAYVEIQQRAHARRDIQVIAQDKSFDGIVRQLSNPQRKILGKWLASCAKGKPDRDMEPEVYQVIVDSLKLAEK